MVRRLLLWWIQRYQARAVGRRLMVACNFQPSCSAYCLEALERHGLFAALALCLRRVRRCNDRNRLGKIMDPLP